MFYLFEILATPLPSFAFRGLPSRTIYRGLAPFSAESWSEALVYVLYITYYRAFPMKDNLGSLFLESVNKQNRRKVKYLRLMDLLG